MFPILTATEVPAIKNGRREIMVRVRQVKEGHYLAYYHSEVMQATVSPYFRDTITGAIALNNFCERLRIKNSCSTCSITMDDTLICNQPIHDVIDLYTEIPVPA